MYVKQINRANRIFYGLAGLLFLTNFFPIDRWFGVQNWGFLLTFFVLPGIGLLTLPLAIYTKQVRHVLLSSLLVVAYFIMASLHICLMNYRYLF